MLSVSEKYQVPLQDLAELNNIEDPKELRIGRPVFIPGVRAGRFKTSRWKKKQKSASLVPRDFPEKIEVDHGRFSWPIRGDLSSVFGVRKGRRHDGLDIRASRGTPIHAAAAGEVVYSKRLHGYGNLILLKHSKNFFTVYAHNSVNLVKKGQKVEKRQVIGKVGSTGRATGPHLHFEVREGKKPRNPLFFLPKVH
ncbi:MAG: LysM peptidoglycan-binding domain-containing M23 family metallopeptidase [Deltaproteobacteria bacterium]|nr:LysM peptidoglycan-binding domain-containing M23 family metallopeptidase [Deltaproteobacteria bacterium]